jgi:hypothetical protein
MLHIIPQRSGIYDILVQIEVPLSAWSEVKDVRFLSPIQERHFQFSQLCGNQPRVYPQARPITYHSSLFHHKLKQSRCSQLSELLLDLLPDLSSLRLSYKSPSPWQSDSYLPVSLALSLAFEKNELMKSPILNRPRMGLIRSRHFYWDCWNYRLRTESIGGCGLCRTPNWGYGSCSGWWVLVPLFSSFLSIPRLNWKGGEE